MSTDPLETLIGSPDYPAWRAAIVRAQMGDGPVPGLPRVLPIHELADEASDTRGTRPVSDDGARRAQAPGSRTLADLDRILCLDHSVQKLWTWAERIRSERHADGVEEAAPSPDLEAISEWLARRHDWAARQPWAANYHADLIALHGELRHICRVRSERPWPCLTDGCRETMRPVATMLRCDAGHEHAGLDRWRHHPSIPAAQAAALLGIPAATVRQWRHRGAIPTDTAKPETPHVWPWDLLRKKWPDLVRIVESQ